MRLKTSIFSALVVLTAAGCSSTPDPRIVSADALGVTYRVAPDRQSEAETAANAYCQTRNRTAQLRSVTPAGNDRTTMSFACV